MSTRPTSPFVVHTLETAPAASRPLLQQVKETFGFIPNLHAVMANQPATLETYMELDAQFAQSSFTPIEQQSILLAISDQNQCEYCIAAHATVLKSMLNAPADQVDAVRESQSSGDPKLDALTRAARELVDQRGELSAKTHDAMIAAGYTPDHVIELLIPIALKSISNYLDNIAPIEIDAAFHAEKR